MKSFFEQKVVIITGSSMGIGKSLALYLGKQKAHVVLNARNAERLLATEIELKEAGCSVVRFVGDITNEKECDRLIQKTIDSFGKIDILVNNAGVSMRGKLEHLSPGLISTIFNINTIAPIILTKKALPYIEQTKGSIVFISSLAALRGLPVISIYSAAKMALTAISQSLRFETKPYGIHVGLVYVGITKIEKDKTALDANGKTLVLDERKGIFTESMPNVAKGISLNIEYRKKQSIIGFSGKVYYFLIKFFPRLMDVIIHRSQKKVDTLSK